jgi:hypothetical protein
MRLILVELEMSKVLHLLDYQWHLNHDHIEWLEEQFYKQCKEES